MPRVILNATTNPAPAAGEAGAPAPGAAAPPPVSPDATAAQVSTAKQMVEDLGYDLKVAGTWLFKTAGGAFESIEHAIEHILK
jgi:hypothetical protein